MIDRKDFLFGAATAGMAAAGMAPATLGAKTASKRLPGGRDFLSNAIVLSGGGALGAYEAGIIWQLAKNGGASDGQLLRPYEMVAGTSIGALNGWFVATGQYTKLREMWHTIAQQNILRLKPDYQKLTKQTAGVADRLAAAMRLAHLAKDQQGVAESGPVLDWIKREIDPRAPVLMPFVFAVTDLQAQQPEYFYRLRSDAAGPPPQFIFDSLRITVGPNAVVREATDDILHLALQASANLPFVFDPVTMPGPNGTPRQYVDGGVASNSPVGAARTIAKAVDVVLLNPPVEEETLPSAVDIGLACFGTMQNKILESELRQTFLQARAKRDIERLAPGAIPALSKGSPLFATFLNYMPATDLAYVRPAKTLPVKVGAFDDQEGIDKSFDIGMADIGGGFIAYDWTTFRS